MIPVTKWTVILYLRGTAYWISRRREYVRTVEIDQETSSITVVTAVEAD